MAVIDFIAGNQITGISGVHHSENTGIQSAPIHFPSIRTTCVIPLWDSNSILPSLYNLRPFQQHVLQPGISLIQNQQRHLGQINEHPQLPIPRLTPILLLLHGSGASTGHAFSEQSAAKDIFHRGQCSIFAPVATITKNQLIPVLPSPDRDFFFIQPEEKPLHSTT